MASMRTFETGATRDHDNNKLDFEGFLSPLVLERFAEYMHAKRKLPDGSMRDSDNWQLGIPVEAYMKSLWRHFFAVWKSYRRGEVHEEELCAVLFNAMGMLHETRKKRLAAKDGPYCDNCERAADYKSQVGVAWCESCADRLKLDTNNMFALERL